MTVVDPVEVFLTHNGIKGMKWGVRKEDSTNPRSSKALVSQAKANFKVALKDSQDRRTERNLENWFRSTPLNYSQLSTQKVTIAKGKEIYRLSKRKNELLRDMTYVSTNKDDRDIYRSVLSDPSSLRKAKASYSNTYESTFKATKKLTSPSEKERVDAFIDILGKPSINVGLFRPKMITGRDYLKRTGYKSEIKKLDNQEVGLRFYNSVAQNQFVNNRLNTAYFDEIRKRGYNALVDDNDRKILSKEPLMILDTTGSIKRISIKQLTNDDINTAIATIKPLPIA